MANSIAVIPNDQMSAYKKKKNKAINKIIFERFFNIPLNANGILSAANPPQPPHYVQQDKKCSRGPNKRGQLLTFES